MICTPIYSFSALEK
jgi:hypothetical protein